MVTTVNDPSPSLRRIVSLRDDWTMVVVGDRKTPADWACDGALYLSVDGQAGLGSSFAEVCPYDHYARKNIGYLKAIALGASVIAETDDDNSPYDSFLADVRPVVSGRAAPPSGWVNAYASFTAERVWPRGFPLEEIGTSFEPVPSSADTRADCPVQQYLVDGDPDVDAVFRLTTGGDITFRGEALILSQGSYCPFNSQATVWWPKAYELLYLPCTVSFRVTDIWRSFVAQRCLHAAGLSVAFLAPALRQERNVHVLLRDFADEIPGYLHNARLLRLLDELDLAPKRGAMGANMRRCYEALVESGIVPAEELSLLERWLADVRTLGARR